MEFQPKLLLPPAVSVREFRFLLISLFYIRRGSLPSCEWRRKQGILRFRRGSSVSHLLFADDSLLFTRVHMSQAVKLKEIFAVYKDCSGQIINFDKSNLFFSKGAPEALWRNICSFLRISEGQGSAKYLGLPFMTGRSKKEILSYLHDRVWKN